MSRYYSDLSGAESSDNTSDGSEDDCLMDYPQDKTLARIVIHGDVDCFYCQCEMLDRQIDADRPLAIGQKHIIATCNYAARKYGISKLCSRDEAYRKCPSLLIVEGSDLERYRIHGRRIYECFRRECKALRPNCAVCKGSMDEMFAELPFSSGTVSTPVDLGDLGDIFLYGQSRSTVQLTEDQTGASTTFRTNGRPSHVSSGSSTDMSRNELLLAAKVVALRIRQTILEETGFTVTMGVSTNPLMAKLASGLQKPHTVNVLESGPPAQALIASMPLRKIQGIGRQTMKALEPCLRRCHGKRSTPWTCRDLLKVPKHDIIKCLNKVEPDEILSTHRCELLQTLCMGVDASSVVDDEGGLQKTLSVENSFQRGTVRTRERVLAEMDELYHRLPRLLRNRTAWSSKPAKAFPSTIRVTSRTVIATAQPGRRRPFATHSRQMPFDGRALLREKQLEKQGALLKQAVTPIVQSLVLSSPSGINVTRINVALCNFADVPESPTKQDKLSLDATSPRALKQDGKSPRKKRRIDEFFGQQRRKHR